MNIRFSRALDVVAGIAAVAALASGLALQAHAETLMQQYDSNHDGVVSSEEFARRGGTPRAFTEADANGDGRLDEDELIKASSLSDRIKAGAFANDSWITTKVKAMLAADDKVSALDVKVETSNGIVQLSGFVQSAQERTRAATIAAKVDGVRSVVNSIIVRS